MTTPSIPCPNGARCGVTVHVSGSLAASRCALNAEYRALGAPAAPPVVPGAQAAQPAADVSLVFSEYDTMQERLRARAELQAALDRVLDPDGFYVLPVVDEYGDVTHGAFEPGELDADGLVDAAAESGFDPFVVTVRDGEVSLDGGDCVLVQVPGWVFKEARQYDLMEEAVIAGTKRPRDLERARVMVEEGLGLDDVFHHGVDVLKLADAERDLYTRLSLGTNRLPPYDRNLLTLRMSAAGAGDELSVNLATHLSNRGEHHSRTGDAVAAAALRPVRVRREMLRILEEDTARKVGGLNALAAAEHSVGLGLVEREVYVRLVLDDMTEVKDYASLASAAKTIAEL